MDRIRSIARSSYPLVALYLAACSAPGVYSPDPGNPPGGGGGGGGGGQTPAAFDPRPAKPQVGEARVTLQSLEIDPSSTDLTNGYRLQFHARGKYSDGSVRELTSQMEWFSSDEFVVRVSNEPGSEGLAEGVGLGSASVHARLKADLSREIAARLTVNEAELLEMTVYPADIKLHRGETQQFIAAGRFSNGAVHDITESVYWTSSDEIALFVSNEEGSRGFATATGEGTAVIAANFKGMQSTVSMTVAPAELMSVEIFPNETDIAKGAQVQFAAIGLYSDGAARDLTQEVEWNSSDESAVVISNEAGTQGLATGNGAGYAVVTATLERVVGSVPMRVVAPEMTAITIEMPDKLAKGQVVQFRAIALFSDGSSDDLTDRVEWTSSDDGVLYFDAELAPGQAVAMTEGEAQVSAMHEGMYGDAHLSVAAPELVSLTLTPGGHEVRVGEAVQFTAMGLYSDGSELDVTAEVNWYSSDNSIASAVDIDDTAGRFAAIATGECEIIAQIGDREMSTHLIVNPAEE